MTELLEKLKASAIPGDVEAALKASRAQRKAQTDREARYKDFDRQISEMSPPPEPSPAIPWTWLTLGFGLGAMTVGVSTFFIR